jgi:hypothetical protein
MSLSGSDAEEKINPATAWNRILVVRLETSNFNYSVIPLLIFLDYRNILNQSLTVLACEFFLQNIL